MALDIATLRAKYEKLQEKDNRFKNVWKPKAGKQIIRILPWMTRPDNPFIELYFHYFNRRSYLSPITNGNADPIAEFADSLRETGEKEDWQFAKQFTPKLRTFVPVVIRGEEDRGVRFWGFGKTVYTQLVGVITDPDWGDITDPVEGRDVGIHFIPQKDSDTNYAQTDALVKPNKTPLSQDSEQMKDWLTNQPDICEIFTEPTYEELEELLKEVLNPKETKADAETTEESAGPATEIESPVSEALDTAATDTPADGEVTTDAPVEGKAAGYADDFEKLFSL